MRSTAIIKMSFLNDTYNLSLSLSAVMTESSLNVNVSRSDVPTSLQLTRFVVQTILTPVVVIVGLLGNLLNILVLLQPSMRTSTNIYILVLSLADSVFLVFNFALSFLDCRKRGLSNEAYHFNPYGRFVSNFSGNVAVWVTVSFTVERYIAVCHPMRGKIWCTVRRAKLASLGVTFIALINTLPTIFELDVVETQTGLQCVSTRLAESFSYSMVYSWWYVTLFTFVPLVCLALFNIVLIKSLLKASKNRQKLVMIQGASAQTKMDLSDSKTEQSIVEEHGKNRIKHSNGNQRKRVDEASQPLRSNNDSDVYTSDKTICCCHVQRQRVQVPSRYSSENSENRKLSTTSGQFKSTMSTDYVVKRQSRRMSREQHKVTLLLVTIVMIFLLCQLPWTALFLYKTYLANTEMTGNSTHMKIAGNICNLLGLINSSVNFYLYSCFSKRFRRTFAALILFWKRKSNLMPTTV